MRHGIIAPTAIAVTTKSVKYLIFIVLFTGILTLAASSRVCAQEAALRIASGGTLTIQGDNFVFEQISTAEGEIVDHAVWEGGVVATFGSDTYHIILETGKISAVFDGPDVSQLRAGPQVVVNGLGGKARFECADVEINFPANTSETGTYTGICRDVHGYYLADAVELNLEGNDRYEINFTAQRAVLRPDSATLEFPALTLGNLDHPDLAIHTRQLDFVLGVNPYTSDRGVLGIRAANVVLHIFGVRLNVFPFPYWRGFVKHHGPGLEIPLPVVAWHSDDYLEIDQKVNYNFMLDGFDYGPVLTGRFDLFPFSRSYPEMSVRGEIGDIYMEARAGYRMEEDSGGNGVPTIAEPEINAGLMTVPLGDTGIFFNSNAYWGHIREMRTGLDLDRYGYDATLDYPGIQLGDLRFSCEIRFEDLFYQGGHRYRNLASQFRLRYADPPRWGATLIYRNVYDWGLTPFVFDEPRARNELGLSQQTRFSRRWGAGFNWAWDFGEDDFSRQECHLTYILDSFQVSMGWDFFDDTVSVRFGLPGSLQ